VTSTPLTLFLVFLRLGLTSFGGPVAHLGYFRTEFVTRRRWLSEQDFGDIIALCQFLPGPASSQAGIAIGLMRGGLGGAVAAWAGFTLTSALLMIGFAYATGSLDPAAETKWLHGLLIVAVAVVAQAVWGMSRSFAADIPRATVAFLAAVAILALHGPFVTLAVLSLAALIGWRLLPRASAGAPPHAIPASWPRWVSWAAGAAFFALLIGLPLLAQLSGLHVIALIDRFYRVGALVFGGGHVVLPMLQAEIVPQGWVSEQDFLAGYGAAQAVPGPLFTFAAYLGAVMRPTPNGWLGGLIALMAIFLPSFLMVTAAMPYWTALRRNAGATAALAGVNAAVVGILLAALYTPVWTSAIHAPIDVILALAGFAALQFGRAPPWSVVLSTALAARFLT
jgi:chromate transporter